jgi:hypothetical protein
LGLFDFLVAWWRGGQARKTVTRRSDPAETRLAGPDVPT